MQSDYTIAAVILVSILVIFLFSRMASGREGFASEPSPRAHEVYRTSRNIFDKTKGQASYSEYKTVLEEGADPVLYTDTRKLWKEGRLSPSTVQSVL
jgi:hypothetical protein